MNKQTNNCFELPMSLMKASPSKMETRRQSRHQLKAMQELWNAEVVWESILKPMENVFRSQLGMSPLKTSP